MKNISLIDKAGLVLIALEIVYLIITSVIRFLAWYRCKDNEYSWVINPCYNTECKFRHLCSKWEEPTEPYEHGQELLQYLEDLMAKDRLDKDS